jgi:hypothetical protein
MVRMRRLSLRVFAPGAGRGGALVSRRTMAVATAWLPARR